MMMNSAFRVMALFNCRRVSKPASATVEPAKAQSVGSNVLDGSASGGDNLGGIRTEIGLFTLTQK